MKAYSIDLRFKIIEAYEQGEGSQREIAERFKVSPGFIQNLLKLYRTEKTVVPKPHTGSYPPILTEHFPLIQKLVAEDNDATLAELCAEVEKRVGLCVSVSTMGRALQLLGLTRKKNTSCQPS